MDGRFVIFAIMDERTNTGGEGRNRTGVHGFAGRCMTTLPPRLCIDGPGSVATPSGKNKTPVLAPRFLSSSVKLRPWTGRFFFFVFTDEYMNSGAGNETRTRDPDLGKVVLYQLSYSRVSPK